MASFGSSTGQVQGLRNSHKSVDSAGFVPSSAATVEFVPTLQMVVQARAENKSDPSNVVLFCRVELYWGRHANYAAAMQLPRGTLCLV